MTFAERPAAHLRRLMAAREIVSPYVLGRDVWPDEAPETSRQRIRNWRRGHRPNDACLVAVAAYFDVDPGYFFQPVPEA